MPVKVKPLSRPDVLRPCLKAIALPPVAESRWPVLAKWAELLDPGRADLTNDEIRLMRQTAPPHIPTPLQG